MKKWQHGLYISAIVILAFTTWLGTRGLFTSAEKILIPPAKEFEVGFPENERVTFEGGWKVDDDYGPMNKTHYKYVCTKKNMTCQVVWTPVSDNVLLIETATYQITNWDDKQITLTDQDECRPSTVVADLTTQQVTQIEQDAPEPRDKLCSGGPKEPKKSVLVNAIN